LWENHYRGIFWQKPMFFTPTRPVKITHKVGELKLNSTQALQ